MSWKAKAAKGGSGDFEKAPPGNHPAVLIGLIGMGIQENEFGGEKTRQRRAMFVWELVTEKNKAGGSFIIGIDLTVSLNEKAKLRQWIEARTGKPMPEGHEYDLSKELGKPCMLNVTEKNGYPKVAGMAAVPKGFTVPAPTRQPFIWDVDQIDANGHFELPSWVPYLYGEPLSEHIKRRVIEDEEGEAVGAGVGNGNSQQEEEAY